MVDLGLPRIAVRVSCGWPSHGGLAPRATVIGQCFPAESCEDGKPQIFISPRIADSAEVLGILLHELIHVAVGCESGHGRQFSQAARKVGLIGPPTATRAGEALQAKFASFITHCGAYPHAAIRVRPKGMAGSRLRLYQCDCDRPIKVRVASDVFQARCLLCDRIFHPVPTRKAEQFRSTSHTEIV